MKALEYLKDDLQNIDARKIHTIQYLEECIAELEALENISCESCKHLNKTQFVEPCISCRIQKPTNYEAKGE